jgi:ribonuclease Z
LFSLTILGCNSAIPSHGRYPTAQVLQTIDSSFLIDCGEGTQLQLSRFKIKTSKISHIFISHLHGDHYFGLIGLLSSMSLLNRTNDLHLFGPSKLLDIINLQLEVADVDLNYPLHFHAINAEGEISNTGKITVECFKVSHRIECWGFIFREIKNPRSVLPEEAKRFEVPAAYFSELQKGKDYTNKKGTIISNESLTQAAKKGRSYAYCADTLYMETLADKVKDVDLLYHETTYLKNQEEKARSRYHSTTTQAANIAKLANAGRLIIGHFSSKYDDVAPFLSEAKEVFNNTVLAEEGTCYFL